MSNTVLDIKGLTKTYHDGTQALKNVSLCLPTGMVGLLGPNGAGKSTLMRTIVGLQHPDAGQITLWEKTQSIDVVEYPEAMRRTLGYLPQYFGVYPHLSCQALLTHIAVLKGVTGEQQKQQISKLLTLTNLDEHASRAVSDFSGGMKQRFGIAQALLGDPKVVIMDEPTAGLDPEERERLHDMLVSISHERLILLSTHIVEDVENLCTHAAFMFDGCVVGSATVESLVTSIQEKIWTVQQPPTSGILLNKSFRFGQPVYRVYADQAPNADAESAVATLQDKYFLEKHYANR